MKNSTLKTKLSFSIIAVLLLSFTINSYSQVTKNTISDQSQILQVCVDNSTLIEAYLTDMKSDSKDMNIITAGFVENDNSLTSGMFKINIIEGNGVNTSKFNDIVRIKTLLVNGINAQIELIVINNVLTNPLKERIYFSLNKVNNVWQISQTKLNGVIK